MSAGPAAAEPDTAKQFGSFRLGGAHLALPLESMREVVPCSPFIALPADSPG